MNASRYLFIPTAYAKAILDDLVADLSTLKPLMEEERQPDEELTNQILLP